LIKLGAFNLIERLSKFKYAFKKRHKQLKIDYILKDGDKIELHDAVLSVIWTLGHSKEHICLHNEESSTLFSGDHILPTITSHISLHTYETWNPLSCYRESLKRLKDLPIKYVYPGHEKPFQKFE